MMHLPWFPSLLLTASLVAACGGCYCGPGACGPQACLPPLLGCLGAHASQHACDSGCGEVYVDPWINETPTPDPCDSCGNYNGQTCGTCRPLLAGALTLWGYRYQGNSCDAAPGCGLEHGCGLEPGCGFGPGAHLAHEPGCGFEHGGACGCGHVPSAGHAPFGHEPEVIYEGESVIPPGAESVLPAPNPAAATPSRTRRIYQPQQGIPTAKRPQSRVLR